MKLIEAEQESSLDTLKELTTYEQNLEKRIGDVFKTQRPSVNVGLSYAMSTIQFDDPTASKANSLEMSPIQPPEYLIRLFGLRSKYNQSGQASVASSNRKGRVIMVIGLIITLIISSLDRMILGPVKGDIFTKLLSVYVASLIILSPVVFRELSNKVNQKIFGKTDLLKIFAFRTQFSFFLNAMYFLNLNILAMKSLRYGEFSAMKIFSSQILVFFMGFKYLGGKGMAVSDIEVKGALLVVVGLGLILLKKLFLESEKINIYMNIFQQSSPITYLYAIGSSILGALFYRKNYNTYSKFPKYTNIFFVLLYSSLFLVLYIVVNNYFYVLDPPLTIYPWREILEFTNIAKVLVSAILLAYGHFCAQIEILKYIDTFMMNCLFLLQPFYSILMACFLRKQNIEPFTFAAILFFLVPGNLMILIGIQQFEDRYQGGEIGFSLAVRDTFKINHLKELEMMDLSCLSEVSDDHDLE